MSGVGGGGGVGGGVRPLDPPPGYGPDKLYDCRPMSSP